VPETNEICRPEKCDRISMRGHGSGCGLYRLIAQNIISDAFAGRFGGLAPDSAAHISSFSLADSAASFIFILRNAPQARARKRGTKTVQERRPLQRRAKSKSLLVSRKSNVRLIRKNKEQKRQGRNPHSYLAVSLLSRADNLGTQAVGILG
jgi:hypothetical protein